MEAASVVFKRQIHFIILFSKQKRKIVICIDRPKTVNLELKAYESAHRWRSIPNFIYEANTVLFRWRLHFNSVLFFSEEIFLWNTKLTNFVSFLSFFRSRYVPNVNIVNKCVSVKFDIFVSILHSNHLRKKIDHRQLRTLMMFRYIANNQQNVRKLLKWDSPRF